MNAKLPAYDTKALDFAPLSLAIRERPPSPLPRAMLWLTLLLFVSLLTWSLFGKLDIIAVAEGKLVPKTYVKIVQPADAGIVSDILVAEGDHVSAGQVLLRLDTQVSEADTHILRSQLTQGALQLARIDAELADKPFAFPETDMDGETTGNIASTSGVSIDPVSTSDLVPVARPTRSETEKGRDEGTKIAPSPALLAHVLAQYQSHRRAYEDSLAEQQAALAKAKADLAAAFQVKEKLANLLPTYLEEEAALKTLADKALAPKLDFLKRKRKRIETEQDLKAQLKTIVSLKAAITQTQDKLAKITSTYREKLQNDRMDTQANVDKLIQELAKQKHKNALLELKAPQDGVIKDLGTHTIGAVVNRGTVLMTLVPTNEMLEAEVMIRNDDIGFVHEGQTAKVKLVAYPFQKYGLVNGEVTHVSADAEESTRRDDVKKADKPNTSSNLAYKATVILKSQFIERDGERFDMTPGMQVVAEIDQGKRTVMEYLLSPVKGVFHDAWRER